MPNGGTALAPQGLPRPIRRAGSRGSLLEDLTAIRSASSAAADTQRAGSFGAATAVGDASRLALFSAPSLRLGLGALQSQAHSSALTGWQQETPVRAQTMCRTRTPKTPFV